MYIAISISEEDVALIMGRTFKKAYPEALQSAHCPRCRKVDSATIEVEQLWLNPAGDVLVDGKCASCGGPLDKLIETGVDSRQYDQAMAIREYKIDVSKDYEVRI